jgi:hypothetical protein
MPLKFDETKGNIAVVTASGKLTDDDHEMFMKHMETLIERWGRLRMLFRLDDFEGWDVPSLWNEIRFELQHKKDLKRVAVIGEKKWEEWATRFSRLLTGTDVRYFSREEADEGRRWLEAGW